jgi:hypothetical protein
MHVGSRQMPGCPISVTRLRLRRLLPCTVLLPFVSLPFLPLSVPVDSAAAVVPGALRWAGGGRGAAGGGAGRSAAAAASSPLGSISPPFFPSLTPSCCFLARRPGLF